MFLGRLLGMAGFEKLVAIKVIHPHLVEHQEFVEMFLDEARLSAQIHHPNVVEIFEVGEEEGLYFMVAELVRGRSLKDLLTALTRIGERLEPRLFLSIITQVCDGLHAAHTLTAADGSHMGLVHRDITPSNILVAYDGFVKLIDFGIAFAHGRITTTRSGVVKGKFGFMAPEQLKGAEVDRRSDIFSLGVVLYLLATGRHPFPGATEGEQVNQVLNSLPIPPRKHNPSIERELERVINKALAKEPGHRHQSAEKLGMELRTILASKGGPVDSIQIAELMSWVLGDEMREDKKTLDEALASLPKVEPMATPISRVRDMNKSPHGFSPRRLTDVIRQPLSYTSKGWRRVALLLTVGVISVLAIRLITVKEKVSGDEILGAVGIHTSTSNGESDEVKELLDASSSDAPIQETTEPKKDTDKPERRRPRRIGESVVIPPELEQDAAPSAKGEKSVTMLLKGLPENANVQVDGRDTPIEGGRIIVWGDGINRELTVIAEGYEAYTRIIAPTKDGELEVELRKKRGQSSKSRQTKKRNPKAINKKLMECPYCD